MVSTNQLIKIYSLINYPIQLEILFSNLFHEISKDKIIIMHLYEIKYYNIKL